MDAAAPLGRRTLPWFAIEFDTWAKLLCNGDRFFFHRRASVYTIGFYRSLGLVEPKSER